MPSIHVYHYQLCIHTAHLLIITIYIMEEIVDLFKIDRKKVIHKFNKGPLLKD